VLENKTETGRTVFAVHPFIFRLVSRPLSEKIVSIKPDVGLSFVKSLQFQQNYFPFAPLFEA